MSISYRAVQWNGHKRVYDSLIALAIVSFLVLFMLGSVVTRDANHQISPPILLMRATAICSLILLHLILCIGPLCRLDRRFLPLLYNRRHLGVSMFLLAFLHSFLAIAFYHGFGNTFPLVSALGSNTTYRSISAFPFEVLGILALLILFVMAATSHDFWLKFLTPRVWKSLHMTVYLAYALLIGHVMLGAIQSERNPVYLVLVIVGAALVCTLHIAAGMRETAGDRVQKREWIDAGLVTELQDLRAKVVCGSGERIAIFRCGQRISAMSNICAHQAGPIGEGQVINGCVTCPWHGYQYQPNDATSPPPFTEKLPTYPIRIVAGRVMVDPNALPAGTDASVAIDEEYHDFA